MSYDLSLEGDLIVVDHVHDAGKCLVYSSTLDLTFGELGALTAEHDGACPHGVDRRVDPTDASDLRALVLAELRALADEP